MNVSIKMIILRIKKQLVSYIERYVSFAAQWYDKVNRGILREGL